MLLRKSNICLGIRGLPSCKRPRSGRRHRGILLDETILLRTNSLIRANAEQSHLPACPPAVRVDTFEKELELDVRGPGDREIDGA